MVIFQGNGNPKLWLNLCLRIVTRFVTIVVIVIGLFVSKKVFHERVSFFYLKQIFGQSLHRYHIHSTTPAKASDRLTHSLLHSTNACNACGAKFIAFLSAIQIRGTELSCNDSAHDSTLGIKPNFLSLLKHPLRVGFP